MSTHASTKINQKEYLKKYLSGDKEKKKRKKEKKLKRAKAATVKIIDDDTFNSESAHKIDEELLLTGDDAPQIVGEYIEERTNGVSKWRSFAVKDEPLDDAADNKINVKQEPDDPWGRKPTDRGRLRDEFSPEHRHVKIKEEPSSPPAKKLDVPSNRTMSRNRKRSRTPVRSSRRSKSSDQSPPRQRTKQQISGRRENRVSSLSSDQSPPRKNSRRKRSSSSTEATAQQHKKNVTTKRSKSPTHKQRSSSSDLRPARERRQHKSDRKGRRRESSDQSPQRKQRNRSNENHNSVSSKERRNSSSDQSPRRRQRNLSRDQSPIRKRTDKPFRRNRRDSSDQSPPRRRNSDQSPPRRNRNIEASISKRAESPKHRQRNASRDQSPRRKQQEKQIKRERKDSSDQSPIRRRNSDQSPPRRRAEQKSPLRIKYETKRRDSASPTAPRRKSRWEKSASKSPPPTHKPKLSQTLDGKKAGLQDAISLKKENEDRRRQEARLFEEMSKEVSGRDAELQVRSTGRRGRRAREAEAEDPETLRQKEEYEKKKKEKFDRWGKGLKQIEAQRERKAEEMYESSKPLARYANDEDLDRHLREVERADDPMLEYMRDKRKEKMKKANIPTMPKYEGTFPENRYGIRPGYRWDGVDRSNGYERRWFEKQNERRAVQDEAYKYSVEDM